MTAKNFSYYSKEVEKYLNSKGQGYIFLGKEKKMKNREKEEFRGMNGGRGKKREKGKKRRE